MRPLILALLVLALPHSALAGDVLLVGNKGENSVSFIDLADGQELGRAATGRMPHEIAISPDGSQAAVVAYGGRTIDIFQVAKREKLRTIDLSPNEGPHGLVWLPDGRLVVTTERSRTLTIVDTRAGDKVSSIASGQPGTHMVAVSPDHRRAYATNIPAGKVTIFDLAAGRKLRDLQVGGSPEGIALTPDGRTLWVADLEGARVQAFDAAAIAAADPSTAAFHVTVKVRDGTRQELDSLLPPLERELRALPGAGNVRSSIEGNEAWVLVSLPSARAGEADVDGAVRRSGTSFPKGRTDVEIRELGAQPLAVIRTDERPIRVLASPDGQWIVTSNHGQGSLSVIDAGTRALARTIPVSGTKEAEQVTILFSKDGQRLYAAETGRNQVAEIDFASGQVLRRLPAGAQGDGLAIAVSPR